MGSKVMVTIKGIGVGNIIAGIYSFGIVQLVKRIKHKGKKLGLILDENEFELDMKQKSYSFDVEPGEHAIAARDPDFASKLATKSYAKALGGLAFGMLTGGGAIGGIENAISGVKEADESLSKTLAGKDRDEWNSAIFSVNEGETKKVTLKLTNGGKVKIVV